MYPDPVYIRQHQVGSEGSSVGTAASAGRVVDHRLSVWQEPAGQPAKCMQLSWTERLRQADCAGASAGICISHHLYGEGQQQRRLYATAWLFLVAARQLTARGNPVRLLSTVQQRLALTVSGGQRLGGAVWADVAGQMRHEIVFNSRGRDRQQRSSSAQHQAHHTVARERTRTARSRGAANSV